MSDFTVTVGTSKHQTDWPDRLTQSWDVLTAILTIHSTGEKDGDCFVPAQFRNTRRLKDDASQIDLAFLDSDCGHTLAEIEAAIRPHGWRAAVHSTFSHLTTRTETKKQNWVKFRDDNPIDPERQFLLGKGYLPHVVEGARIVEDNGEEVTIEHQPCPKFRVVLPLSRPWLASDYPDQNTANASWKAAIEALAAALGLHHDQSCTDTNRLFYLPRRPANGPQPETAVIEGTDCDIWSLPPALPPQHVSAGAVVAGRRVLFGNPMSGTNLTSWAAKYASRFEIAKALRTTAPGLFTGKVADQKHHIACVNSGAHSDTRQDDATFIMDASASRNGGFVYHCRHAHCTGVDRLEFLRQFLEAGALTVADLTDHRFLTEGADTPIPGFASELMIGSDVEIARHVGAALINAFGRVVFSDGLFWRYAGTAWEEIPERTIRATVHRFDGAEHAGSRDRSVVKLSKARIDSIIHELGSMIGDPEFFVGKRVGINCAAGFIGFTADGTPSIIPHSPDHRCRHTLPGVWPSTSAPDLLNRLLAGCFLGDEDADEKIALLGEIAGAAALGHSTKLKKPVAVIFAGKTAENGKSQILDAIRGLLPPNAVSSIPPSRFGDEQFVVPLAQKLLNASDELSSSSAIASDAFKAVITGDPITGKEVYKTVISFRSVALNIFATNDLPTFRGGMDRGVMRRLLVLPFDRVIPIHERIEGIGQRVAIEEADQLLAWAVQGASRLIKRGFYHEPETCRDALRSWARSADPVQAWVSLLAITGDSNDRVLLKDAFSNFRTWATAEGYRSDQLPAVNNFAQRLTAKSDGIKITRPKNVTTLVGIQLPPPAGFASPPG